MNKLYEYAVVAFITLLLSGGGVAHFHSKWVDEGKAIQLKDDTDAANKAIAALDKKAGILKTTDDTSNTKTGTTLQAIGTGGTQHVQGASHAHVNAVPAACSQYSPFTADWVQQYDGTSGVHAAAAGQADPGDGKVPPVAEAPGAVPGFLEDAGTGAGHGHRGGGSEARDHVRGLQPEAVR